MPLLETVVVAGAVALGLKMLFGEAEKGDEEKKKRLKRKEEGKKKKKEEEKKKKGLLVPEGDPPIPVTRTFNHSDAPSVRWQFTYLGYANAMSTDWPEGPWVNEFKRDYNSVSAMCLNAAAGGTCKNLKLGRLPIGPKGVVGPRTTNALEAAKRVQATSLETWTNIVQNARVAGF